MGRSFLYEHKFNSNIVVRNPFRRYFLIAMKKLGQPSRTPLHLLINCSINAKHNKFETFSHRILKAEHLAHMMTNIALMVIKDIISFVLPSNHYFTVFVVGILNVHFARRSLCIKSLKVDGVILFYIVINLNHLH